jgi:Trk K+ transport system NAD-binding subunit
MKKYFDEPTYSNNIWMDGGKMNYSICRTSQETYLSQEQENGTHIVSPPEEKEENAEEVLLYPPIDIVSCDRNIVSIFSNNFDWIVSNDTLQQRDTTGMACVLHGVFKLNVVIHSPIPELDTIGRRPLK